MKRCAVERLNFTR